MQTDVQISSPESAVLFRIRDIELHPYMQRYPLLTGPNETLNRKCFSALIDSIEFRNPVRRHDLLPLTMDELVDEPSLRAAGSVLLQSIGISAFDAEQQLESRAWKMCLVPSESEAVLALGCGDGAEIAALRARLPNATIVGLDWTAKIARGLFQATQAEFDHGNFNTLLALRPEAYDLIFSNHVLEHSFDPETLFAAIYHSLTPGGWLVSALPLDGNSDSEQFVRNLALLGAPGRVVRGDLLTLNIGHPYKTNASDLTETILAAGFSSVKVLHRPWHPTLFPETFQGGYSTACARRFSLHDRTFGLAHRAVASAFGTHPPLSFLRVMGAVESRAPLGSLRLYVRSVREAVIIARK